MSIVPLQHTSQNTLFNVHAFHYSSLGLFLKVSFSLPETIS